MPMIMAMMVVAKRSHSYQVDKQPHRAHDEELCQPLRLPALNDPLEGLEHDLDANQAVLGLVWGTGQDNGEHTLGRCHWQSR